MAAMDKLDISVSAGGDIRKDGLATNHTGLEFYRLMMDLPNILLLMGFLL